LCKPSLHKQKKTQKGSKPFAVSYISTLSLTSVPDGGGVSGHCLADAFLPPEKESRYLFHTRLGGSRGRSGVVQKITVPVPAFKSRTVQPVASRVRKRSDRIWFLYRCPLTFRHPAMTAMPDALLQPFSVSVWPCLAVSWILLTVSFRFIAVFKGHRTQDLAVKLDQSWSSAFFVTIGTIAEQSKLFNLRSFNDAISSQVDVPSKGS